MENVTFEMMPKLMAEILERQKGLENKLSEIEKLILKNTNPSEKPILTIEETCDLLQISRQTLWKWEKQGVIRVYGIEKRRYYKYFDIINLLTPLNNTKVPTQFYNKDKSEHWI